MTRLVHRIIEVNRWCNGEPDCFHDGQGEHRVDTVIDRWLEMGNWWDGEGSRILLRVITDAQEIFDLECVEEKWFIYRVWD